MHWRAGDYSLLEFDLMLKHHKGAGNSIADAISRLPTYRECRTGPDVDLPCFLILEGNDDILPAPCSVEEPFLIRGADDDLGEIFYPLAYPTEGDPILATKSEDDPTPIQIDELVEDQAKDPYWSVLPDLANGRVGLFSKMIEVNWCTAHNWTYFCRSSSLPSKCFQAICSSLGNRNLLTMAYHSQASALTEWLNHTILVGMCHYVVKHPRSWSEYS